MLRRIVWLAVSMLGLTAGTSAGLSQPAPLSARLEAPQVATETLPPGGRIELALGNERNPTAMVFAPDGRWFFTERTSGFIKMIVAASRNNIAQVPTLAPVESERGLLGIALDPNFAVNGHLYVYYTSAEDFAVTGKYDNRVARLTLQGNLALSRTVLLTVPLQSNSTLLHNGGNVHFGPDGKLYVSIGDYFNAANGQDLGKLQAKIHRFNTTVPLSAPSDNPFFSNPGVTAKSTFGYGFRNPFDFDFDPVSGKLFAADNGVACDDELNRVLPGYNYGWRANYPDCDDFGPGGPDPAFNTIPPLLAWPYSVAPTGVMFYGGDLFPEWKNDLFLCHWKTGELNHFRLNASRTAIVAHSLVSDPALGTKLCHLDIEDAPNGEIYFIRNITDEGPAKEYRDIYRITRDPTIYASTFTPSTVTPAAGETLTYTMRLAHYSLVTSTFTVTASLPPSTTLVAGSLQAGSGTIDASAGNVIWTGSVPPNRTLTASYRVAVSSQIAGPKLLANAMTIVTDQAGSLQRGAWIIVNARAIYLPAAFRAFAP